MSCTAPYTVTQADVDAGTLTNTATYTASAPGGVPMTADASTTIGMAQNPQVGLTKTASPSAGVVAGTTINYAFDGQNTGNVTLHNVSVTDPLGGLSAISCTPTTPATLAPGATIHCTATYTVTQADVDAGAIHNTATINGLDPSNNPVTKSSAATVTANQTSTFSFAKTASPTSGVIAGSVVTYSFDGTNTGVTTLHNVGVTDPMAGLSAITCTPVAPATLAPNASIHCTATYTVTQADVDAGSIVNSATLSGLTPSNSPIVKTAGTTVTSSVVGLSTR